MRPLASPVEIPLADRVRQVVPEASATISGVDSCSIHADHMNMTKFKYRDENYDNVKSVMERWIGELVGGQNSDTLDNSTKEDFFAAIRHNDVTTVRKLAHGLDLNKDTSRKEKLNSTGLASDRGKSDVFKILVDEFRAHPDLPDSQWQQRPLFRAAKGPWPGHPEIVKYLVARRDVDVDAQDDDGQTALAVAADFGRKEAVEILLDAGADPMMEDNEQRTALSRAKDKGRMDIVELLKSK